MRLRRLLLLGVLLAIRAEGQDSLRVRQGQRVRISTRTATVDGTGVVVALTGDTLLFRADRNGYPYRILLGDLATLDTSKGSRAVGPGGLGGAVMGLGLGALAGTVVGKLITNHDRARNRCPNGDCDFVELVTIPVGALIGFAVGGVIGSQLNAEGWAAVPLSLRTAAAAFGSRSVTIAIGWQPSWLAR